MFRHTKKSWTHAPCALQPPHEVEATKENPVVATVREFLIEDLTPFAREIEARADEFKPQVRLIPIIISCHP